MSHFRGKIAIVTGGASGIGRALGKALVDEGATVVLADLDEAGVEEAAGQMGAEGVVCDVTDAAAVEALVAGVVQRHGRIDYMFNNAGIAIGGEAQFLDLDDWRRTLEVDVMGVVHGVHAVYPRMIEQGSGHIVNTASLAGLIPAPGIAPYCAAKHAVVGMSLALRAEGAEFGVKVSAICPGFVRTPIVDSLTRGPESMSGTELVEKTWPVAMMTPEECAAQVLRGLRKDVAIIVMPRLARVLWRVARWFPNRALGSATRNIGRVRRMNERYRERQARKAA